MLVCNSLICFLKIHHILWCMWTLPHADTDFNIFAGVIYRAHPVIASKGNRLTSYLQTFG